MFGVSTKCFHSQDWLSTQAVWTSCCRGGLRDVRVYAECLKMHTVHCSECLKMHSAIQWRRVFGPQDLYLSSQLWSCPVCLDSTLLWWGSISHQHRRILVLLKFIIGNSAYSQDILLLKQISGWFCFLPILAYDFDDDKNGLPTLSSLITCGSCCRRRSSEIWRLIFDEDQGKCIKMGCQHHHHWSLLSCCRGRLMKFGVWCLKRIKSFSCTSQLITLSC